MSDMDRRIEAARSVISDIADREQSSTWAEFVLKAAFPELFTDPPTHVLVPLEPTEAMIEAGRLFHLHGPGDDRNDAEDAYRAMVAIAKT